MEQKESEKEDFPDEEEEEYSMEIVEYEGETKRWRKGSKN